MKNSIFLTAILLLLGFGPMQAHEGHGDAKSMTTSTSGIFKSEAVSDKYEYVVKYAHADAGEQADYTLYINEFASNRPVTAATLALDLGGKTITAQSIQPGIYAFSSPVAAGAKNLKVSLSAASGADLALLKNLDPAQAVEQEVPPAADTTLPGWVWALIGGVASAALILLALRFSGRKAKAALALTFTLVSLSRPLSLTAHEGHGDAAKSKNAATRTDGRFVIAKESQFLFGMLTARVQQGQFAPATKAFGTVIASPQGQAEIISPQTGRIASLNVKVGARVRKGQLLATVEQVLDAQTRTQLEAERNNLTAELAAARADYERLQSIADIAAKRDLTEAQARYYKAVQNKRVFDRTVSGQGRNVALTSPIDGVVQSFTFAIGANVNAGETVFTVTNLSEIFVEAQVFDKDLPGFTKAQRFTITCADPARKHVSSDVRLVNIGQTLNTTNQSQRVIFQVLNGEQDFKLGEFVDVRAFAAPQTGVLTVPSAAIAEVDGKPVVFTKHAPEEFSASFVQLGESNGDQTVILNGIPAAARIVTSAAFQAKMIYENP